jgi:ribosomal protein L11 methyltransferase
LPPHTPGRWLVISVPRPSDAISADLLIDALVQLAGRAVWEENGLLVTHVPEPADPESFIHQLQDELRSLAGVQDLALETRWQPHEDWAETWKRGLAPRRVTPRMIVTPTWEKPDTQPSDLVIRLDPGMAFGNAEHGTTRGCLRLMDGVLAPGHRVLDVGAGSGVLSIAAALLGASEVIAVEIDPHACEVARENLVLNGVADRVTISEAKADPATLPAYGAFDGVLANLEGGTLRELLPGLKACVVLRGWVILSGLLAGEAPGLLDLAAAEGLAREAVDADGEWRSLLLRRGA